MDFKVDFINMAKKADYKMLNFTRKQNLLNKGEILEMKNAISLLKQLIPA